MKRTMTGILLLLPLLMGSRYGHAQKRHYNISDFGAVGDGITLATHAINQAIEQCAGHGGGRVVVPPGSFKSGTILMKGNVELHLEMGSTLLATTDEKDYPTRFALIYAEGVSNIAITGLGTLDGNGALQKPDPNVSTRDKSGRVSNILFISCRQVRVEGVRMLNSGAWMQHYLNCEDVIIDRIEVYNHANRNNDALNIDGCRRFVLSNSIIDADDDGIVLKNTTSATTVTEDVTITNCVVSSKSNAIKAGTESNHGFRNISISNCVIRPTRHKASATWPTWDTFLHGVTGISLEIVDGGVMEGVAISNMVIEGTECPLYIRLANRRTHTPTGKMRNITLSNIVARNTGNFSNSITGIPGHCVENVTIDNIQLFNQGGLTIGQYKVTPQDVPEDEKGYPSPHRWGNLPSSLFFIRHVKGLSINNLLFGSNSDDPRTPVVTVDVERLRIGKSLFSGVSLPSSFAWLEDVREYDIEKPVGWGQNPVVTTEK